MPDKKQWKEIKIKHNKLTKWNWMVQYPEGLKLGKNVDIGAFTYINAHYGVEIGNNVEIGGHCIIYSHNSIDDKKGKVIIGNNAKIGANTVIMPGITIGENALIGACSLVKRDIPDNALAYGVPVKIIKRVK